jgi:hypothetical protein
MSRESEFRTVLVADATLMAILTGGIFMVGTVGRNGITSEAAPAAFDTDGNLKPCALIRQRDLVPDQQVQDFGSKTASAGQTIEIWVYQEINYDKIDLALPRIYSLLQGLDTFAGGFEAEWTGTIDRLQDDGALAGASVARQDWFLASIV